MMHRFLCVYLAGPLASFGETAGNVQRTTADRPTLSALLGLAGAALGIDRQDDAGQVALTSSFSVSTRTIDAGVLLTDFHTFEGISRTKQLFSTRAEALRSDRRNTSITRREYRSGGVWQAAYQERQGASLSLEDLHAAFLVPRFALWLGRKSCPLAHPLVPLLVEADDIAQAFATAHVEGSESAAPFSGKSTGGLLATGDPTLLPTGNRAVSRHRRLDQPIDRKAWTFRTRNEFVFSSEEVTS